MVITVEPGCYFNPALLKPALEDSSHAPFLVKDRIKALLVGLLSKAGMTHVHKLSASEGSCQDKPKDVRPSAGLTPSGHRAPNGCRACRTRAHGQVSRLR